MEENNLENKKTSKEIWLVLIFIDIIALCVFTYLIYTSFVRDIKKVVKIDSNSKTEEVVLEEVDLPEPITKQIDTEVKNVIEEPKESLENKKEIVAETQIKEEVKPLLQKEPKEIQKTVDTDVKESIKIAGSGKWRQVTFKYFDDAKHVAIVSGFTLTKPQKLKKVNGVWQITLTISPGTYRYMFIVDGKETKDPYNKQESNGRSLITVK